jgi:UDP:flavonoid glycosyltransferase YjiC (YdhE family)
VLFLNVPLHGHINPTLDLASELVARGNDVVYYASASFREKIEATGAEFRFPACTAHCCVLRAACGCVE